MSLTTYCTTCGKAYPMDDTSMEGKKVSCKKCGTRFVVSFDGPAKTAKAKKAKPGEMSSSTLLMITAVSVLAGIGMWAGILTAFQDQLMASTASADVKPVEVQFVAGKSNEGRFSVQYPSDWDFKTGGGSGGKAEFVTLKTDGIEVSIRTNLKASAMLDVNSGGGTIQDGDLPPEEEPIAKVHQFLKSDMELEMSSYEEGSAQKVETGMGNSRIATFSGDRGLMGGGMAYGFRATMPCRPDAMVVVAKCDSEKIFQQYNQVLKDIILNIGR